MNDRVTAPTKTEQTTNSWEAKFPWVIDLLCSMLCIAILVIGIQFWKDWFSTPDRVLCSVFAILGLIVGIARIHWGSAHSRRRFQFFCILLALSTLVGLFSWSSSRPDWSCLALGMLFASWVGLRGRSERASHAIFLGALIAFPFFLRHYQNSGYFDVWQSSTLNMAAGLASVAGLPFAREGKTILFAQGNAEAFEIVGIWDGPISWIGLAIGCVFAMRRNLISAFCSISIVPFVWMTIRSTAWLILAILSHSSSTWYDWSFSIALGTYLIGIAIILGIDIFFSRLFQPIPFELFNAESPLICYAWNWICGLPGLRLRVPKNNKIYASWRVRLKKMKKEPSLATDLQWFRFEFMYLFSNPLAIIGGLIDAVRGWLYSRQWRWIWRTILALGLPCLMYILYAFSFLSKSDKQVRFLGEESQKLCPTTTLEIASKQIQEPAFARAMGGEPLEVPKLPNPLSKPTLKYAELLSKRILGIDRRNQMARYRLGLIYAAGEQPDRATEEMKELASGQFGFFPEANQWLAKDTVVRHKQDQEVPFELIVQNVDKLIGYPHVDDRLLRDYVRLLELRGDLSKAVTVAKNAAEINPELKLDLAMLYGRIRHPGLKDAAEDAKDEYQEKLDIQTERESDRIAVAKALMLAERWEQAEATLEAGLKFRPEYQAVRRELSNLQIRSYQQSIKESIKENDQRELVSDLSLLEKAVATDPNNPNISTEIAKMIPLGIVPSDLLKETLSRQLREGSTTVDTHLLLGDVYFKKGDVARAKIQWKSAMDKDPKNIPAINNYAYCLAASQPPDKPEFEQSIDLLNQALQLSPENAEVLDTLGEVYMLANRPREAVNKFELSIAYNKKSIPTRKKLLEAYRAAGLEPEVARLQQVIIDLEKAAANEPDVDKKP